MQVARFRTGGHERWGAVDGDLVRLAPTSMPFGTALIDEVARAHVWSSADEVVTLDTVLLEPPVPSPPQFIGVGMNYRDHAAEVNAPVPTSPVTFGFYPNAVIGPGAAIELPSSTAEVDWEVELAIVIGTGGRDIPLDRALDAVAGYTIVNDVSARDVQFREGQWGRAKSFDTFKPMGPWIVTTDELGDGSGLAISLTINDIVKQDSSTDQLIFDVRFLVSHLSQSLTLLPGAVISTGTPGGVGLSRTPPQYLQAGDRVEAHIEGIGWLTNPVTAGGEPWSLL